MVTPALVEMEALVAVVLVRQLDKLAVLPLLLDREIMEVLETIMVQGQRMEAVEEVLVLLVQIIMLVVVREETAHLHLSAELQ